MKDTKSATKIVTNAADHPAVVAKAPPTMKVGGGSNTKTITETKNAVPRASPTMKLRTKTLTDDKTKDQPTAAPSSQREDDNNNPAAAPLPTTATIESSSSTKSVNSRHGDSSEQPNEVSNVTAGAFAVAGPGARNESIGDASAGYGHVEYGSGYDFSGRTFPEDSSTLATNDDNVGEPFRSTASTANTMSTEERSSEQVGAYEVNNMGSGGSADSFMDHTESTFADSTTGRTIATTSDVEEGGRGGVPAAAAADSLKAQVVSKEQQVKEAFEIVQKQVPHAEVMEVDELLADEAAKHKRRIIALAVAFLVVVIVVVSIVIVVVSPFGDDDDNGSNLNDLPAPNGRWELHVSNINSTCGPEKGWSSDITIEVFGELPTVETNTTTINNNTETNTIFDVEVVGIKSDTNRHNATYDASTGKLVIGPASSWEIGGTTVSTFTLFMNSTSSSDDEFIMTGKEVWVWRDDEYPGGWGECANGTADIEMKRIV